MRVVALALVLLVATAQPVAALTCAQPDAWFLTTISLPEQPSLPVGVFVRVAPRRTEPTAHEPPWDDAALNWLEIENTTPQPVYVLVDAGEYQRQIGYEAINWPDVELGDAPTGMRADIKLQGSTWYGWPTNCAVVRCATTEWQLGQGNLMVTGGGFGFSRGFQDRIARSKSRPANVQVPEAQPGAITLSSAGHTLTIPFVVTYELNRRYDPAHGTDNCGGGLLYLGVVLLLIVSAGIALPVLVLLRLLTRRSSRRAGA
jgi:hypothetical protein